MNDELRQQMYSQFSLKETNDLVEIWVANDRVEWSETAFEVIQEILQQRLDELPPQAEPVFEYEEYDEDEGQGGFHIGKLTIKTGIRHPGGEEK